MNQTITLKKILKWELIGALVIILAGSALHFVFEWTGDWPPAALIAAVNESTWEHLKLAFWPMFIWALIEWPALKTRSQNFCLAKAVSLWTAPLLIIGLFYAYQAIVGGDSLAYDIGIFIAAIIAAQLLAYKIQTRPAVGPALKSTAAIMIIAALAAFSLFTYFPPKFFLFQDPISNDYGIIENHQPH